MNLEQLIKQFLSSPLLFLFVILMAIAWQMINSKTLAKKSGQENKQAWFFSGVMSASIFICVANNKLEVGIGSGVIEAAINVFLVFKNIEGSRNELKDLKEELDQLKPMKRKGKDMEKINQDIRKREQEVSSLTKWTNIFIGIIIPLFIIIMSELYVNGGSN